MSRGWQVEHSCPQCGAPVVLDETDHLMPCRYCRVCCYMVSKDAHRYYLSPSADLFRALKDSLFFLPYWRFRGVLYSCVPFQIRNQLLDASIVSADTDSAPFSLGLRPQVLKLKFLQAKAPGLFPEPVDDFDQALDKVMARLKLTTGSESDDSAFYRAFLGEAYNLIYAPFFIGNDGKLIDGVTGREAGAWSGERPGVPAGEVPWQVKFIPAVCPHCGWDLKGPQSSRVMICGNCGRASATTDTGLKPVDYFMTAGPRADVYLPFWRIKAETTGVVLNSFGDYIRAANLPRAVTRKTLEQDFYFWAPAFKGASRLYLRCCRNVTARQPEITDMNPAAVKNLASVNHSHEEAARGLKMALAHMAIGKRKLFPDLPQIQVRAVEQALVYIPFHEMGRELVNEQVQLSISPEAIDWERQ